MLIIGESLNATRREVRLAVQNHDEEFIRALAVEQIKAGAGMLDVNAAVPGRDEVEDLPWMVQTVQSAVDVRLALDSADPEALIAAMAVHRGRPLINSMSGESAKVDGLIPIVARSECSAIVLCMDDEGIPSKAEGRLAIARKAVGKLLKAGKKSDEIFVDPLVLSLSVDPDAAITTLEIYRKLKEQGVRTTGGLSNVSYGMPERKLLNRVFLAMAVAAGLDSCIVDVRDQALTSTLYGAMACLSKEGYRTYLRKCREGILPTDLRIENR